MTPEDKTILERFTLDHKVDRYEPGTAPRHRFR